MQIYQALKPIYKVVLFIITKPKISSKWLNQSVKNFNAEIPLDEEKLKSLAGVGQKTAHVVLIEWCGANCMAVDTHVFRVSHRLGLSKAKTPEATEEDLTRIFKDNLNYLHQAMVLFGRYTCKAKNLYVKNVF